MNRAHSRSRLRNPLPFNPLNLFSSGEQGAWFDPSDMATLFQDDAGTVPVTAAGQVVGRMLDKSGRGNHATQVTEASKPILRNSGSLWWLEFDGVDDSMATGNINLSAVDKVSAFAGVRKSNDAAIGIIAELTTSASAVNGSFYLSGPNNNGLANYGFALRGTITTGFTATTFTAPVTSVLSCIYDLAGATRATEIMPRVNGVVPTLTPNGAVDAGAGNFSNSPLYIGRRGGATLPFSGNLYGLIIRGALSDQSAISNTEGYMGAKSGVAL